MEKAINEIEGRIGNIEEELNQNEYVSPERVKELNIQRDCLQDLVMEFILMVEGDLDFKNQMKIDAGLM